MLIQIKNQIEKQKYNISRQMRITSHNSPNSSGKQSGSERNNSASKI